MFTIVIIVLAIISVLVLDLLSHEKAELCKQLS